MRTRFIEVQDAHCTNHGKFWLAQFGEMERRHRSAVSNAPLLASLPIVGRFGGPITATAVFLLDLQTQEGLIFDPAENTELIRRRFLVHPLHVCILYFPLMLHLAKNRSQIWALPNLTTLPIDGVLAQPGVLIDATGEQVRSRSEWSARRPLVARLRNREVTESGEPEDGQNVLTADELEEFGRAKPNWKGRTNG